jgi:hypothetical protein
MNISSFNSNARVLIFTTIFLIILVSGANIAFSTDEKDKATIKLRGVSHIHTIYSHDSNATLTDLLNAMALDQFDFAIVTDHNEIKGRLNYKATKTEADPILLFANEISSPDGHLIALGVNEMPADDMSSQELVDWIHEKKGYAILAHPLSPKEPWNNFKIKNWDGFEVYNFGHELYKKDIISFGLDLHSEDEDKVLKTVQFLSPESVKFWDQGLEKRKLTAVVGSNVHLKRDLKYFRAALKSAVLYVVVSDRSEQVLTDAVGQGRSYMVFETYGRADLFSFTAKQQGALYNIGDAFATGSDVTFTVQAPVESTIRLIHRGQVVQEVKGKELIYTSSDAGAYRVEVYLGENLWIFTNPIYLEKEAA